MSPESLLARLLETCIQRDGSDLHMVPGQPPCLRVHGKLEPIEGLEILSANDTALLASAILAAGGGHERSGPSGSTDGALTSASGRRFRFNVYQRQGQKAIALRRLEDRFRSLDELGLPPALLRFCEPRDGLVIVCGPTGAGKSTTLATLLDHINGSRHGHILTIEEPIEYIHHPKLCVINQRQVGWDAHGFNEALVASLRQDPDVILVGEIRDLETIRTAITAAETGHLVFTTLHAGDCVGAVERMVSVFPADEQEGIRRQLALVLRGVVAQRLLTLSGEGRGRVPCAEILVNTPAVANLIATGKSAQIYSAMESGTALGMQTLEHSLAILRLTERIDEETALMVARNPAVYRDRLASLRTGTQTIHQGNGGSRHG